MPYKVDTTTGLIDYDKLEENARLFKPKMIIAGIDTLFFTNNSCLFNKVNF